MSPDLSQGQQDKNTNPFVLGAFFWESCLICDLCLIFSGRGSRILTWPNHMMIGIQGAKNFCFSLCHPIFWAIHPWKIHMEPKNHTFEKENHLPSTSIIVFQPFIFQGVARYYIYSGQCTQQPLRLYLMDTTHSNPSPRLVEALADHEVVEAENSLALRKVALGIPWRAFRKWYLGDTCLFWGLNLCQTRMWVPLEKSTQIMRERERDPGLGPL